MKKFIYIGSIITLLIFSFLGITYSLSIDESLIFDLKGPDILYIDVYGEYEEYGISVIYNGSDISSSVSIDSSLVDTNKLGEYKVKYEVNLDGYIEYVQRIVRVIDKEDPIINLVGEEVIYLVKGNSYDELGYTVYDNYDKEIEKKVMINGQVDVNTVGEYILEYSVVDSSGNRGVSTRKIIVGEVEVSLADLSGNRIMHTYYNPSSFDNTVILNKWVDNGIYYEGYVRDSNNEYKIKLKNKDNSLEYLYDMSIVNNNKYSGVLDLTKIPNGDYSVYVVSGSDERLLNKLGALDRLVRAKVDDKLVSLYYGDDFVNIVISDFKYEYDILIDPGHGGLIDVGAANGIVNEKDLNLKLSMYEKCRYESMGYKVFLTRTDDSYGILMGASNIDILQRRSLAIGYYGAVSKVVYSNHHNASENKNDYGFEILVSNKLTREEMVVENNLYNRYLDYYKLDNSANRVYSRDYNTSHTYNKVNGMVYPYMDYYAAIRIPDLLFNVKSIIFEPIYLSNYNDFNWYYNIGNWVNISEIKIEEYVRYLGGKYIADNSKCL